MAGGGGARRRGRGDLRGRLGGRREPHGGLHDGLGDLRGRLLELRAGLHGGLRELRAGLGELRAGLGELRVGLGELRTGPGELCGGPVQRRDGRRSELCCGRIERQRRRGTWWSVREQREYTEGVDFAQDTQEGGGGEYLFLPNSDDEARKVGFSLDPDDDEIVPETEPQELEAMVRHGAGNDGVHLLSGAAGPEKKNCVGDGWDLLCSASRPAKKNCSMGLLSGTPGSVQQNFASAPGVSSDAETEDGNAIEEVDIGGQSQADAECLLKRPLLNHLCRSICSFFLPQCLGFLDDTSTASPCLRHFWALSQSRWTVRWLTLNWYLFVVI